MQGSEYGEGTNPSFIGGNPYSQSIIETANPFQPTEKLDAIRTFLLSLSKLNLLECRRTQLKIEIIHQFESEGLAVCQLDMSRGNNAQAQQSNDQAQIEQRFLQIMEEVVGFEQVYYSLSYLDKKEATTGNMHIAIQRVRTLFVNIVRQSGNSFAERIAQMLAELELYIRQKNLMMMTYKDDLFTRQDDTRVRQVIQQIKSILEAGPIDQSQRTAKAAQNAYQQLGHFHQYTWSPDVTPLKEHFLLELTTLELILKNKLSALKQDHLSTILTINQLKDCNARRQEEFNDKHIKEQHNQFNNLWKWLLNLQFMLIARNRLFLNGFFEDQEGYLGAGVSYKKLSQFENLMLKKIGDICKDGSTDPIQRVDILFRLSEAIDSPILRFKIENISDQFGEECEPQQKMYIKENSNYIRLYSYCHKSYRSIFEECLDFGIVTETLEEILKSGSIKPRPAQDQPSELVVLKSGHDFVRLSDKKHSIRYHLAQIDIAHYLLISTYTGIPQIGNGSITQTQGSSEGTQISGQPKTGTGALSFFKMGGGAGDKQQQQAAVQQTAQLRENEAHYKARIYLMQSLKMRKYYKSMNSWKQVASFFS
ncbi:hypothetical protein FGO68_gene11666 [Halteria grandinella]|uniref:Cilia- and flagella-associated protein 206 n=1 Tax=Halteria grandinella TaxID=5974 RepID=A0A8J8NUY8_HALGN|nr:hypothetical protein FGO68_gene11666 [Halteria grandinella]